MAKDHFETHNYMDNRVDWNFNILFGNVPGIGRLTGQYAAALDRPTLYPQVPLKWLHLTVLRAGFETDFTREEMSTVAARLARSLAAPTLPLCLIGPAWEYKGYPLLEVEPEKQLNDVFQAVRTALRSVVGDERMPHAVDRPDDRLMPHVALAYTRNADHSAEIELSRSLAEVNADGVIARLPTLSLIRQWPTGEHYEWEVVHQIPIGQAD